MPVKFSKLNIACRSANAEMIKPAKIERDTLTISRVTTDKYCHSLFADKLNTLMNNINGVYSSDDLLKIEQMKHFYSQMSDEQLSELYETSLKSYTDDFNKKLNINCFGEDKEYGSYEINKLTKEYQTEFRNTQLKLAALSQTLKKGYTDTLWIPYSKWFDSELGTQAFLTSKSIFEHPVEKILRYTGTFNVQDAEDIEKLTEKYKNYNIFEIFNEKGSILNKIQQSFKGRNLDFIGQFSDKELEKIKKLAVKYYVLNKIEHRYGYFSKDLETILYSPSPEPKKGNYIEGLGLITDEMNVDGKDCIITFSRKDNGFTFKITDKMIFDKRNNFLNTLPETIYLENLNDINKNAKNIIDEEKRSLISEIRFEIMDESKFKQFLKKQKIDSTFANEIFQNNKDVYLIRNFRNYYKKNSASAGKIIGIKLLKFLKEKNAKPIFIIAQPYAGSRHSPVSMYLYMGFKPLLKSENEVYASMKHFEYLDTNPLVMYLQNFDNAAERIDKYHQIYFCNK